MFDFLYSEAWWMDTLITTIVVSAAGIIGAIIGTLASSRKHDQNLAVHAKEAEKDHAEIKKDIAQGNNNVVGAINVTGKEVTEVRTTLTGLKDRIIEYETEQKARFSNLDDAQKKLCGSAEDIGKFSAEFSKLATENKLLAEENRNLIVERDDLRYRLEKNREIIRNYNEQANTQREDCESER